MHREQKQRQLDEGNKEIEVEMKLGVNVDHVATLRQARGTIIRIR